MFFYIATAISLCSNTIASEFDVRLQSDEKPTKCLEQLLNDFFCSINDSFYDDGHISHHDKKCLLTSERRRTALVIRRWFFRLTK